MTDSVAFIAKIVLAVLFIVGGLGWFVVCILDAAAGDPNANEGPLHGFGPPLTALGIAAIGVLLIIF